MSFKVGPKFVILLVRDKKVSIASWLWTAVVAMIEHFGTKKCWFLIHMYVAYEHLCPKNPIFNFHFYQFLNSFGEIATVCYVRCAHGQCESYDPHEETNTCMLLCGRQTCTERYIPWMKYRCPAKWENIDFHTEMAEMFDVFPKLNVFVKDIIVVGEADHTYVFANHPLV